MVVVWTGEKAMGVVASEWVWVVLYVEFPAHW
jgi:hypothetical protein